jgi:catechol 2,3-dioxygenase-like lactoylglutathione lyase family enzyme
MSREHNALLRALSRRTVLAGLGASAVGAPALAQAPGRGGPPPTAEEIAAALPLNSPGLEHFAMLVPDVGATGRFYSKVFNPDGLHKEKEGALRYYVVLGEDYVAIGGRAEPPPPYMDHFAVLANGYNAGAMAARLEQEGAAPGAFGVFPDPNGVGLQIMGEVAGLAASTEPSTRIVDGDAIVTPIGLDHVLLFVNDLEESLAYYAKFFPGEVTRLAEPERIWIQIADTRLGLQRRPANAPPRFDQFGVKVASFDRDAVIADLRAVGATIAPDDPSEPDLLRFRDPHGFGVALKPV